MAAESRVPAVGTEETSEDTGWSDLVADPWTVAAILAVALTARTVVALKVASPWIMIDELIYSELARSFAETGRMLVRGEDTAFYSLLYPVLIAPAWLANSLETAYTLARMINALLVTVAAVPLYIWARRLVSPGYALVALLLFLVMPSLLYAGTLMTENAFLPAFMLAAFVFALALERPTLARQALALAAIGLATAVRFQGFVLLPVLLSSVLVMALLERNGRMRRFWPTFAALGVSFAAYVVFTVAGGKHVSQVLGAYGAAGETDYSAAESARWVLRHFAELGLAVAFIPLFAFVVLLGCAARGLLMRTTVERAFLAVTAASVVWLPLVSGVFSSRWALRVEERTMFYVAPLLVLALVVWLARGAPRPPALTAAAIAIPAALLLVLPFETLLGVQIVSDTFALIPLLSIREHAGVGAALAVVWLGAAVLAVVFAALPRRQVRLLAPLAVAAVFVATSLAVGDRINAASRGVRSLAGAPNLGWIDRELGRDARASFLYTTDVDPQGLWQLEFWNRSLRNVLAVYGGEPGRLPKALVPVNERTGALGNAGPAPEYVVALRNVAVAGNVRAEHGLWRLYEVEQPLRLESAVEGVAPDGWMGRDAVYTVYRGPERPPSSVEVVLSRHAWGGPDVPGRVRVDIGRLGSSRPTVRRTGVLHSLGELRYVLPAPARPFQVRLRVEPTFSPADFGHPDARELGALPAVRLLAGA